MQMLETTRPDAFCRPSRLDRVEERPTSRSAAWEEKDMDQFVSTDGWNIGNLMKFGIFGGSDFVSPSLA